MRTQRPNLFVIAAFLAFTLVVIARKIDAFRLQQNAAPRTRHCSTLSRDGKEFFLMNRIRGGSLEIDVELESSDEGTDVEDDEEKTTELAAATKKSASKAVKKSVAAAMKTSKKKSSFMSSFKLGRFFKLPYIVKATMNPIVFFQMTVGYWKSLYNINYLDANAANSSQDLRSALEQKARYAGADKNSSRRKRKMKPGQAKTLSDLPQLST